MPVTHYLIRAAREEARKVEGFDERLGPGRTAGNGVTKANLASLHQRILKGKWRTDIEIEKKVRTDLQYRYDFYIPREQTVVEVALSLRNVVTEFEKDLFKVALGKEAGLKIKRLIFLAKPGAEKRQSEPGPMAIREPFEKKHRVQIEVHELM